MFPDSAQESQQNQNRKGHIVLLIDHDAVLGENLLRLLKNAGYRCYFVRNEKDCIDTIKEIRPELVVLDFAYPDIDGYQILEAKKNETTIANIPVVAISDKPNKFDRARATALGVETENQIVSAAIDPQEVLDKVTASFFRQATPDDVSNDVPKDIPRNFSDDVVNAEMPKAAKPKSTLLNGKKILWVEDDKFFSNIFKKRLDGYGCVVTMTKDSNEAFAYLVTTVPNIIILDLVLPGMSGFDILKQIRDNDALANVPVLILSNLNQTTDVERVKILGAQKYLVKSAVSLSEIVDEIELLAK